jgi:hypothetical protein
MLIFNLRRIASTSNLTAAKKIITKPQNPEATVPLWINQIDAQSKEGIDPEVIYQQEVMFEIIRTEKEFTEDIQYLLDVSTLNLFLSLTYLIT